MFDNQEFERIVNKHKQNLYRYCYIRLGNNKYLTDETLTDIFEVLYEKWDTLEIGENIGAYLYRTADNCIKRNISKQNEYYNHYRSFEAALAENEFDDEIYFDEYFKDETPEVVYIAQIEQSLPKKYLELFRLRYVEKRTYEEIGAMLGAPYSTIRGRCLKVKKLVEKEVKKIFK